MTAKHTIEVKTVAFSIVTVGLALSLFIAGLLTFLTLDLGKRLEKTPSQLSTCRDDVYRLSPAKPHFITVNHKASGRIALLFDGHPAIEYDPSKLGDGKSYWWTGSVTVAVRAQIY